VPTLACWEGVGNFQVRRQGQDARFTLNLMPMRARLTAPLSCRTRRSVVPYPLDERIPLILCSIFDGLLRVCSINMAMFTSGLKK
jgi:hypothetical protein